MPDAEHFPITTPYGQVPGYELNNGWHRGEDRAMPMDTPVLVNGHEIGLSGNSGYVTGPHLHIGRFVGGGDTAPNGGGFHFSQAVVTEIGQDATNGKFVRVQADGASWVYLHLSRQSVGVGQQLIPVTPVVASPPSSPASASYAIIENYPGGKRVRLNKQPTQLWGMNYHFDYMKDHPVETHNQGEIWTVTNKVHHEDGYDYYRRDGQIDGFNILDCDEYVEPVSLPAPPAPPAPPTPPLPPAAPIPYTPAEEYTILPPAILYYGSAQDAVIDSNALGQLDKGTYKLVSRDRDMINLSTNYPNNENKWINPAMNVLPKPEPEPVQEVPPPAPVEDTQPTPAPVWKPQYIYLRSDHQPVVFKSVNAQEYPILDFSTGQPTIYMPPHHTVKAVDKFTDSKGNVYYRSESMAADNLGYGIPKALLQEAVFDTVLSRAERLALKSANFVDKAYYAWLKAEKNMKFLDGIKSVFAGINQGKRK